MSAISDMLPDLLTKTIDGKISWSELSERTFTTILAGFLFAVEKDDEGDIMLSILESSGKILEGEWTLRNSGDETFKVANELYQIARKNALKIDKALEQMSRALRSL